ncbi:oxidoreductase (short-chain dehydrogenase family) (macronuclear) [Tetrahymena thermophila SB210]|uniref:Oxidoreductase (Short-chain dehydrogenase family) n=1 Tax=Tetrahymena thermophila (strain SB210) TaxID=312017 RepID=Q22CD6_TETTS|nr:oxidoreductase (short-chain dehydrogenase family) [Tetrahymena thermophila SB210]EAR82930.2 oxidoreductase (short-chain dehydrogenase family) [Tetrahymena thermophila SB210]|eukprot:XP_001030593.2 oxidoreductase (short-chain dehydrogenase family) [Tetrahymena thermophila SB210]
MILLLIRIVEDYFLLKYIVCPLGLLLALILTYFLAKFLITEIYFSFFKKRLNFRDGFVVVLTGGSNGIGLELSYILANNHGKDITLLIFDVQENKEQINILKSKCQKAEFISCDLSEQKQIDQAFQEVIDKYNCVDILINNAAVALIEYFDAMAIQSFFKAQQINLLSYMKLTHLFLNQKNFANKKEKSILFMGSVAGFQVGLKTSEYASSKFGLVMFNEALRAELKTQEKYNQVKLTIINPYQVDTELFKGFKTFFKQLFPTLSVKKVANTVYYSLIQKRNIVFINWHYEVFIFFVSSLPAWLKDLAGLITLMDTLNTLVGKKQKFPSQTAQKSLHSQ